MTKVGIKWVYRRIKERISRCEIDQEEAPVVVNLCYDVEMKNSFSEYLTGLLSLFWCVPASTVFGSWFGTKACAAFSFQERTHSGDHALSVWWLVMHLEKLLYVCLSGYIPVMLASECYYSTNKRWTVSDGVLVFLFKMSIYSSSLSMP